MGILGWKKEKDPLIDVIERLTSTLESQRDDHKNHVDQLIQQIQDQNLLLKELLDQYINRGINTNESLNERSERKDQYLKESEWGPLTVNPFDGEF